MTQFIKFCLAFLLAGSPISYAQTSTRPTISKERPRPVITYRGTSPRIARRVEYIEGQNLPLPLKQGVMIVAHPTHPYSTAGAVGIEFKQNWRLDEPIESDLGQLLTNKDVPIQVAIKGVKANAGRALGIFGSRALLSIKPIEFPLTVWDGENIRYEYDPIEEKVTYFSPGEYTVKVEGFPCGINDPESGIFWNRCSDAETSTIRGKMYSGDIGRGISSNMPSAIYYVGGGLIEGAVHLAGFGFGLFHKPNLRLTTEARVSFKIIRAEASFVAPVAPAAPK